MLLLEGKKKFYFLPENAEVEDKNAPTFVSEEILAQYLPQGLKVAEIEAGDLLYFPGQFHHEVHNLTPDSMAITSGVKWPGKP
jgi:hypothetical protein